MAGNRMRQPKPEVAAVRCSLERDAENSYLTGDDLASGLLAQLQGASISYRVAVGLQLT